MSLAILFAKAAELPNLRVSLFSAEGSMLAKQRQRLVANALKKRCTHVLFLDSDMVFPSDTLERLLAAKKPFIAANCTTRRVPVLPVAHGQDEKRISSQGKSGLQEVLHVGLAVALLEAELLKKLTPPLFLQDWIPDYQDFCGEDVYFCQKVQALGEKCWIDHDLSQRIQHVGNYAYGYKDVKEIEDA